MGNKFPPALAVAMPDSHYFDSRGSPLRASYHGKPSEKMYLQTSQPNSGMLGDRTGSKFDIVGSAESLVGRTLQEQGLGKYCDPALIKVAQKELAEACDLTPEEMDRAAQRILENRSLSPSPRSPDGLQRGAYGGSFSRQRSSHVTYSSYNTSDEEEDRESKL